jgi:hypothetical protein
MLDHRPDSGRNVVGVFEMCWRIVNAIVFVDLERSMIGSV